MPTTNTAELTATPIDGTERPLDPSLLDFLREQTRAAIIERREKLGNGTGGVQEREELAVLYAQALTLGLDPVTLVQLIDLRWSAIPQSEIARWSEAVGHVNALIRWARHEAGLIG